MSTGDLIDTLNRLRRDLLDAAARSSDKLAAVHPDQRAGAINLLHYLDLRRKDLRYLQDALSARGLSSLGRAEPHVLANVEQVLSVLHVLAGRSPPAVSGETPGRQAGLNLLARQATSLFGAEPHHRQVRIMVTLPTEAAHDAGLVRRLLAAGMDVARINAAHDDPDAWQCMARQVRGVAQQLGRPVRVLIDLPGPKLRTGALPDDEPVLKIRPRRDDYGRQIEPARLVLRPLGSPAGDPDVASLEVPAAWLGALHPGERIRCVDARGRDRVLQVDAVDADGVHLHAGKTIYFIASTQLTAAGHTTPIVGLPRRRGTLRLTPGDRLELRHPDHRPTVALSIPCQLPEVFAQVRCGARVSFDDGRIAGVVRRASATALDIEIDHARPGGDRLEADRGINLPDLQLDVPVPTPRDLQALDTAVQCADLVALSFVQRPQDVHALQQALHDRQAGHLGVLLKIETRLGFENLPDLLLAAMAAPAVGVMIARGDLAVELGWQRLAEVQEEVLWAAEAAHLPVMWATQVLETLAHTGQPSRAEITDAAMSVRAEAVMLNKGPHIVEAIEMLDDILQRMQQHQQKKQPRLRALRAWQQSVD